MFLEGRICLFLHFTYEITLHWEGQFLTMLLEHHGLSTFQVVVQLSWYGLSAV